MNSMAQRIVAELLKMGFTEEQILSEMARQSGISATKTMWCIDFEECESGWGRKPYSKEIFPTQAAADDRVKKMLAGRINARRVPEWYLSPSKPKPVLVSDALAEAVERLGSVNLDPEASPDLWVQV